MSVISRTISPRALFQSASDLGLTKGLVLSHAIGFSIFAQFALNFIKVDIPFTPATNLPGRLIALWLILDRNERLGRVRLSLWDWAFAGFILLSSIGVLVNSTNPSVIVDFEDLRSKFGVVVNIYLYFLIVREACNRRGFRPDIMLAWFYVAMSWSAALALMQQFHILGLREWSLKLYAADEFARFDEKAYGTALHFNALAFEMLVATCIAFSPVFRRRPKWWEVLMGLLFLSAFISSESRGGLVAFLAAGAATVLFFFWNGRRRAATLILVVVGIAVLVWGIIVFALKIERFTRVIEGETVQSNAYLGTFRYRLDKAGELITLGLKEPIFGVGRTNIALGTSQRAAYVSASSVGGTLDMMYPRVFAEYGLVGVIFVLCIIAYLLGFIRRSVAQRPFAFAAFVCGVVFAVHGLAEYLIFSRGMMMVGIIVALASEPWIVSERGRLVQRTTGRADELAESQTNLVRL